MRHFYVNLTISFFISPRIFLRAVTASISAKYVEGQRSLVFLSGGGFLSTLAPWGIARLGVLCPCCTGLMSVERNKYYSMLLEGASL